MGERLICPICTEHFLKYKDEIGEDEERDMDTCVLMCEDDECGTQFAGYEGYREVCKKKSEESEKRGKEYMAQMKFFLMLCYFNLIPNSFIDKEFIDGLNEDK